MNIRDFARLFPGPPVLAKRTIDYTFRHAAERLLFAHRTANSVPEYGSQRGPIFPVGDDRGNVLSTKV